MNSVVQDIQKILGEDASGGLSDVTDDVMDGLTNFTHRYHEFRRQSNEYDETIYLTAKDGRMYKIVVSTSVI